MKEIYITEPPQLDPQKQHVADMHSAINILSILTGILTVLETKIENEHKELYELIEELADISQILAQKENFRSAIERIRKTEKPVIAIVESLLAESTVKFDETEEWIASNLANLKSIYAITISRLDELAMRAENPNLWLEFDTNDFRKNFEELFYAIQQNANGLYRIQFNLALKKRGDYYMDLKFESKRKNKRLYIPLRLMDILRDLVANARKYTDPGGKVALAVYQDDQSIQCRIEDNGRGIPEDELEKVVEFGYRATNARNKRTMGGGFGLTKAAWLVLSWNGEFRIASGLNEGTCIRLTIPTKPME